MDKIKGLNGVFSAYWYFCTKWQCYPCKDILSEEKKALTFGFENKISITEFLDLFKRFNVVLTWAKGEDYSDWELDDDTQYIDDRK